MRDVLINIQAVLHQLYQLLGLVKALQASARGVCACARVCVYVCVCMLSPFQLCEISVTNAGSCQGIAVSHTYYTMLIQNSFFCACIN